MTNPVLASLARAAGDLTDLGASWALIGGFAVSSRAEPRFTRDVDVCLLVRDDSEAERLVGALTSLGYAIGSIVEQEATGRLATVRLTSPLPGGVLVDLLFASSGIEDEIVRTADPLDLIPGLTVPVASAAALVVLKLLARDDTMRPQDAADLVALRPTLTDADATEVERLANLVVARGFHRERDLPALATQYLTPSGAR